LAVHTVWRLLKEVDITMRRTGHDPAGRGERVMRQTGELVNALHSVNQHVPTVANTLLAGTLPVAKQREFAGLLIELGNLLHRHADDSPSEPRHALRDDRDEPPSP
jgi:hypothetical protein